MTRSSTKELFMPFKDPEREFRSSRKLLKTLSLDESRLPEFYLFSDLEEYFEEEVAETMLETIEQHMSKTRADYGSLEVPSRQILDSKGVIPSKTAADAKVAIQEMAEYSQKWHNRTSSIRSTKTFDGLAAIQAQLNNLGKEIKKVNEKVYAAQVGCEQARIMGETLVLNRSLDPLYGDYIKINDLNVPLELRRDQVDDLMPTIEKDKWKIWMATEIKTWEISFLENRSAKLLCESKKDLAGKEIDEVGKISIIGNSLCVVVMLEDTTYLCLHFTKDHEGIMINTSVRPLRLPKLCPFWMLLPFLMLSAGPFRCLAFNLLLFAFSTSVDIGGEALNLPLSKAKIPFGDFVRSVNLSRLRSDLCWFLKSSLLSKFCFRPVFCCLHAESVFFRAWLEAATSLRRNVVVFLIISST
nr:hypothetical protein [Tanacetum cinerariifolium]